MDDLTYYVIIGLGVGLVASIVGSLVLSRVAKFCERGRGGDRRIEDDTAKLMAELRSIEKELASLEQTLGIENEDSEGDTGDAHEQDEDEGVAASSRGGSNIRRRGAVPSAAASADVDRPFRDRSRSTSTSKVSSDDDDNDDDDGAAHSKLDASGEAAAEKDSATASNVRWNEVTAKWKEYQDKKKRN